jgi:hypothetical protein
MGALAASVRAHAVGEPPMLGSTLFPTPGLLPVALT